MVLRIAWYTYSLDAMSSWVIVDKSSGKAVCETFDKATANEVRANYSAYKVVPILEWLVGINEQQHR